MKTLLFLLAAAAVLLIWGCKAKQPATEPEPEDSATGPLDEGLHDIWVLISMDGKPLDRAQARPRLELYPGEGRISGNGGCNELFGQMEGRGDEIAFRNVGTTKKFCRDLMDMENTFLTRLQAVDHYHLKDLKLYLTEDKKDVLVFQKVD